MEEEDAEEVGWITGLAWVSLVLFYLWSSSLAACCFVIPGDSFFFVKGECVCVSLNERGGGDKPAWFFFPCTKTSGVGGGDVHMVAERGRGGWCEGEGGGGENKR